MLTAITFALILTSAVVVHELAHYVNARSVGVAVRAFSVGIGPVLARVKWRGTEWRLSLLPLGGYVDLPGMGPKVDEDGTLHHPDEGVAKLPIMAKLWVFVGGVIANYVLGTLLLAAAITLQPAFREITGATVVAQGSVISRVMPDSHAAQLGFHDGDRVLFLNGVADPIPDVLVQQVQQADHLDFVLQRGGAEVNISTPWPLDVAGETPRLGVEIGAILPPVSYLDALGESAAFGIRVVPEIAKGFVAGFGAAITGAPNPEVAGPVGMVSLVSQATRVGLASVLLLAAVINFSLGVFNLLPIPGLDGGRMFLAVIVALRGKPFQPGQEEKFHFAGIMLVMALIVLITFRELSALFT
ncbi:MAG: RIP metalloprotease [Truepera sp.]|jgi:regulator of sigma E protease|nr:RIP metalloprotease [Truepera sp.]